MTLAKLNLVIGWFDFLKGLFRFEPETTTSAPSLRAVVLVVGVRTTSGNWD
jgi:hypothetical protein